MQGGRNDRTIDKEETTRHREEGRQNSFAENAQKNLGRLLGAFFVYCGSILEAGPVLRDHQAAGHQLQSCAQYSMILGMLVLPVRTLSSMLLCILVSSIC